MPISPAPARSSFHFSEYPSEGSLWIAAVGHGLQRWVGQDRWEALTTTEGLSDGIVWTSLRDRTGGFWIGTESGLDRVAAASSVVTPWRTDGIETPRAVSLAESPDGTVWLGSAAGKLVRIGEQSLAGHAWKTPEIYRILCDSERHLWLATVAGLYLVETDSVDQAPLLVQDPSFTNPRARFSDLTIDAHNRVWAASDLGLFRLDGNRWHHIDPGISNVNPSLIAADQQGNLWASGNFPGVIRLNVAGDSVVESAPITRPRLLSDQVVSLFADSRGWLWVGQDAGLTVYDGSNWRSFTQDDGLVWNDLDSNGIGEDADGSMWIGTSGGLSHLIKPETLPVIAPQPPAIPQIAYGATAIANGARIPWNAGSLAISMAILSFRDAHHIHIRYRLLGLESDWVETADELVRYPRLEPGNYRFQAETVEVTGGAVSAIREIDFRIAPRWWQSGELRIALALLSGILVALWWRFRINRSSPRKPCSNALSSTAPTTSSARNRNSCVPASSCATTRNTTTLPGSGITASSSSVCAAKSPAPVAKASPSASSSSISITSRRSTTPSATPPAIWPSRRSAPCCYARSAPTTG